MKSKKAMGVILVGAVAMSMCASVFAEEASISTAPNEGGIMAVSGSSGIEQGPLNLAGSINGICHANFTDGGELRIPIEKPEESGAIGMDMEILKGADWIESVSVKDGSLIITTKNTDRLAAATEYSVNVTLYDMNTGKPSTFNVSGTIGASKLSTEAAEDGETGKESDTNSEPEKGSGSSDSSDVGGDKNTNEGSSSGSTPSGSGDNTSSSEPDSIKKIALKGAENGVAHADIFKYGGDDKAEFIIQVPEGSGAIRLEDKDIVDGRDVIKKVSVKGSKLVIEGKFPSNLLEPEDYTVDVTLSGSKSGEEETFRIEGTVFWQDSYGPVSPDEYRERKYVVVDFDDNDGETVNFENGCLRTDGLKSGVANLDISYAGSNIDCDGLDIYCVNFTANPRLDRNVTVCLDAEHETNCVYQVTGDKLVKIDAKYNKSAQELRFEAKRLGEYIVTEKELDSKKADNNNSSNSSSQANTSSSTAGSQTSSSTSSVELPPETGSESGIGAAKPIYDYSTADGYKKVPNTGRYVH